MNRAFLPSYPHTGGQRRGKTHEPAIGVVVGRTGFPSHLRFDPIPITQPYASTVIDDIAHHRQHFEIGRLAENFGHLRGKIGYHISEVILDTRDIDRIDTQPVIGESRISRYHLLDRDIGRSKTQRHDRIDISPDSERVHQPHQRLRRKTAHKIGRNPVDRLGQAPSQRNILTGSFIGRIAGRPNFSCCAVENIGLHIGSKVARRVSFFHRQRIEIRLDGGTYLTTAVGYHIEFEITIIDAADIRFHMTASRIDRHHTRAQQRLAIPNRVHRGHRRIERTFPREKTHRNGSGKR